MTYKWDAAAAERYAKQIAEKVADEAFADTDVLDGQQILASSSIKQVNLFILRTLYDKWQAETDRLRSPYFDFQHPEVVYAFEQFKNILSQYIALKRSDFVALASDALFKTMQLYLQPASFFEQLLRELPGFKLSPEFLQANKKFFTGYRFVLEDLEDRLQQQPLVYANEAMLWAADSLAKHAEASPEEVMSQLADYQPIPNELKGEIAVPEAVVSQTKSGSFFDSFSQSEEPISVSARVREVAPATPVVASQPIKPAETVEIKPPAEKPKDRRLNEQFEVGNPTLNDAATQAELGAYHRMSRIDSIRKSISLNQRFLFTKALFDGNSEAFNQAIDELDALQTYNEARDVVLRKYAPRYVWDVTSNEAEEFLALVKRRFS